MAVAALLAIMPAVAQEQSPARLIDAWDWMTPENLETLQAEVMREIEVLTRIRFRRPVEVDIVPRAVWEAQTQSEGYFGETASRAAAYYWPGENRVTFQPWVYTWQATAREWRTISRQTMIHELTHALHHQNFFTLGGDSQSSLRSEGLTERQIDTSTVDFLLAEGFAELVTYSLCLEDIRRAGDDKSARSRAEADLGLTRRPERRPASLSEYMRRYQPNGEEAYRTLLFNNGYQDGLTCVHHLMLGGGMRAVRSVLYRIPPRVLLFAPDLLAEAPLDDPPEPDPIFRYLHPGELDAEGILLATAPGEDRFFRDATLGKTEGCLLGYTARATSGKFAGSQYAFFVGDPDRPGDWAERQFESLVAGAASRSRVRSREIALPLTKKKIKALITRIPTRDGCFVHGRVGGLVVLARESKPTPSIEQRVLMALRALHIKRPTPATFDEAIRKARERLAQAD